MKEIIIVGFENATSQGVTLVTNKPARLRGHGVRGTSTWVSWDKIGSALFEDYTDACEVVELDALRDPTLQRGI